MTSWRDRVERDMVHAFGPSQGLLVRGEGAYVEDVEGKRYLDFLAGIAVNVLGHAHPVLADAIAQQAKTLIHVSNFFSTPPQLELAARLKRLTGAGETGRVFFANSGTEANEGAFKLARLNRGEDGRRTRVLSMKNSFHGRTMGALALTGKPAMHTDFEPLPGGVEYIDTTIEALEEAFDETVAAVILEPIKGEAGVLEVPDAFLQRARALTSKTGALLMIDEIQTGVGRTGGWFGYQRSGIVPDVVTVAKGIAGGVPMGAVVTLGAASELIHPGQHGTTFGGNPLATATANAVLGEIETAGLVENAARRGDELVSMIAGWKHPLVTGVRGRGLLLGISLGAPVAKKLHGEALERGLIVNAPNDETIRLAPPLIIGEAELSDFEARFTAALSAVSH
ncbi:acetylornithine transaminase [Paramicrobacterium sp. CJ85]|uniref:acetylornithine transaminase n=1 Tax=Paramicrobacterium sp. CJ85 TaxID=3445355 RepID=UPI003F5DE74D